MDDRPIRKCSLHWERLCDLFPDESSYVRADEQAWSGIAGTILLGLGQEAHIHELCCFLLNKLGRLAAKNPDSAQIEERKKLDALRVLREALLKASPLVGFPRSINGLTTLQACIKSIAPELDERLRQDKSLRASVVLAERQKRGRNFFGQVYAEHTERVLENLNSCSGGDLAEFAINCVYGDLVAETSILGAKETGLLEFVACLCLGVVPQAKGHMYGARNLGNSGAEIRAATALVKTIASDLQLSWNAVESMEEILQKAENW